MLTGGRRVEDVPESRVNNVELPISRPNKNDVQIFMVRNSNNRITSTGLLDGQVNISPIIPEFLRHHDSQNNQSVSEQPVGSGIGVLYTTSLIRFL